MSSPLYIKISDKDNVAIAVNDIPAGTLVMDGVRARQDIPQAHKIALCDIPAVWQRKPLTFLAAGIMTLSYRLITAISPSSMTRTN